MFPVASVNLRAVLLTFKRNASQVDIVNSLSLLTAKPVIYLVNLSEKDYVRKKNKWLPKIKEWIDANGGGMLLFDEFADWALKKHLDLEDDDDFEDGALP